VGKKVIFFLFIIFLVNFISAFGYDNPTLPKLEKEVTGDININETTYDYSNTTNNYYNNTYYNVTGGGGDFNSSDFQSAFNNNITGTINNTQFDYTDGILSILESWLKGLFYTKSEVDTYISGNASSGGNLSWNQSYANTLYSGIQWNYNQTTATYNLYGSNWYNHTSSVYDLWNSVWSSTFNSTYAQWAYNQTVTYYSDEEWINKNSSNSFNFNESKLSTIYYNATQSQAIAGTVDGGTLEDTQHPDGKYDGKTFNFSEASGSPGLDMRINFTGIDEFNQGVMRYKTSNLAGAYPIIQMWNYDTSAWEDYPPVAKSLTFATIEQPVFDSAEHVDVNGIAQMRIYKASNGNTNNHYYVDWIAIAKGYGTPSGEEVDPYSVHKTGDTMTGNLNMSNNNITDVDWFFGKINWSNIQNIPSYVLSSIIQSWITGNKTLIESTINSNVTQIMNNNETWSSTYNSTYNSYAYNQSNKIYEENVTINVIAGKGYGQTSTCCSNGEIIQVAVFPTTIGNIYNFNANQTSDNYAVDTDRIVHTGNWIIAHRGSSIVGDTASYKISNAYINESFRVRIRWNG